MATKLADPDIQLTQLTPTLRNLSPLDGRYHGETVALGRHVSEWALMRYRLHVEVEWIITLGDTPEIVGMRSLTDAERSQLRAMVAEFDDDDAEAVKGFELATNHDVKAIEYFFRDRLPASLDDVREFIHFALTSEDVNNLAHGLMLKGAIEEVWRPAAAALVDGVEDLARATRAVPMLSHTHGQPATPTTFGKEMAVFVLRWRRQLDFVDAIGYRGKTNGAVGTYSGHLIGFPDAPWQEISRDFVETIGLVWSPVTTQIEPHDWIGELFHALARFNSITLDFARDMWDYISRGYIRQRVVAGEVGSSTMPHKVNPIDFEKSQANAGLSTAIGNHMATTLAQSHMQRDLCDSSLMRNGGVVIGHSLVSVLAATKGLGRVGIDSETLARELDRSWEVLAEAVQIVMRKYGSDDPYGRLKLITRGAQIDRETLLAFVNGVDIPEHERQRLLALTPALYTGLADDLVDHLNG